VTSLSHNNEDEKEIHGRRMTPTTITTRQEQSNNTTAEFNTEISSHIEENITLPEGYAALPPIKKFRSFDGTSQLAIQEAELASDPLNTLNSISTKRQDSYEYAVWI
jgi:hypothetical protein